MNQFAISPSVFNTTINSNVCPAIRDYPRDYPIDCPAFRNLLIYPPQLLGHFLGFSHRTFEYVASSPIGSVLESVVTTINKVSELTYDSEVSLTLLVLSALKTISNLHIRLAGGNRINVLPGVPLLKLPVRVAGASASLLIGIYSYVMAQQTYVDRCANYENTVDVDQSPLTAFENMDIGFVYQNPQLNKKPLQN